MYDLVTVLYLCELLKIVLARIIIVRTNYITLIYKCM